jgi:hypothetical protein
MYLMQIFLKINSPTQQTRVLFDNLSVREMVKKLAKFIEPKVYYPVYKQPQFSHTWAR